MADPILDLPCAACGARNRVPRGRLKDVPVCGRCKNALLPEHPVSLDDTSFSKYVSRSSLPIIVDFWAEWCGPCKAMAPQFEAAAREHLGQVLFAKVDTEAAQGTAGQFGIQSIPTLVLFRDGQEAARQSGALSAAQIGQWLSQHTG